MYNCLTYLQIKHILKQNIIVIIVTFPWKRISMWIFIATDKRGIHIIFFLFLHKNICCGYTLEAPRQGTSN